MFDVQEHIVPVVLEPDQKAFLFEGEGMNEDREILSIYDVRLVYPPLPGKLIANPNISSDAKIVWNVLCRIQGDMENGVTNLQDPDWMNVIEVHTGLKKPEIQMAFRDLEDYNWVVFEECGPMVQDGDGYE